MFLIRIMEDHDGVIYTVNMQATLCIFPLVILHNQALLPVGNEFPDAKYSNEFFKRKDPTVFPIFNVDGPPSW